MNEFNRYVRVRVVFEDVETDEVLEETTIHKLRAGNVVRRIDYDDPPIDLSKRTWAPPRRIEAITLRFENPLAVDNEVLRVVRP